jgi:hypothetical protein
MIVTNSYGSATVLDVLENALGSRPTPEQLRKLTVLEIAELAGRLGELSEAQSEEDIPGGAAFVGGWLGTHWSEPFLKDDSGASLLYYSKLLVLDPLADYFDDGSRLPTTHPIRVRRAGDSLFNVVTSGPAIWSRNGTFLELKSDPQAAANRFASIVENLYSLENLIRGGIVILRSQWPILYNRRDSLASSVRHDIRSEEMQSLASQRVASGEEFAVWDNLRGLSLTFSRGVAPSDQPWENQHVFYYLAKTLAIADASGAQYVPSTERDLELLRTKANAVVGLAHPGQLLHEIARVVVPSFDVPIKLAVKLRVSSANFQDWRSSLDRIRRAGANDTPAEMRDRVQDELRPAIRAVSAELNRTSGLRSLNKLGADVIFSGGLTVAAAIASGGNPYVAAGAAGATGIVGWIRRAYSPQSQGGSAAVLSTLVRGTKKL